MITTTMMVQIVSVGLGALLALAVFILTEGPCASQHGSKNTREDAYGIRSVKWRDSSAEGRDFLCENFVKIRRKSYCSGATYSTKTGYLFKEQIENESVLNGCNVKQVNPLDRHTVDEDIYIYIYIYICI